jgi:hypothetical protein
MKGFNAMRKSIVTHPFDGSERYFAVEKKAIQDERLSWAARGLWVFLQSNPTLEQFDRRLNADRDGLVEQLLEELETAGYIESIESENHE